MDNAKIIKIFLSKINVFYAPPYSPFLNPIEEFFSVLKSRIRNRDF